MFDWFFKCRNKFSNMKKDSGNFKYQRYHIPNVAKTITVLQAMSKKPNGMTRAEINAETGFSESIIFRIIYTMLDYGMIVKNPDRSYSISKRFISLAYDAISDENLILSSRESMNEARDKLIEPVMLGILSDDAVIMIDQAPGKSLFGFTGKIGMRCPLHSSAPAKAILAFLPDDELESIASKIKFEKYTSKTITSKKRLLSELSEVRKKGYAIDHGEYMLGANCVGVPIFDLRRYPVASIWVTGASERIPAEKFSEIGEFLVKKASAISEKLGYNK